MHFKPEVDVVLAHVNPEQQFCNGVGGGMAQLSSFYWQNFN